MKFNKIFCYNNIMENTNTKLIDKCREIANKNPNMPYYEVTKKAIDEINKPKIKHSACQCDYCLNKSYSCHNHTDFECVDCYRNLEIRNDSNYNICFICRQAGICDRCLANNHKNTNHDINYYKIKIKN